MNTSSQPWLRAGTVVGVHSDDDEVYYTIRFDNDGSERGVVADRLEPADIAMATCGDCFQDSDLQSIASKIDDPAGSSILDRLWAHTAKGITAVSSAAQQLSPKLRVKKETTPRPSADDYSEKILGTQVRWHTTWWHTIDHQ